MAARVQKLGRAWSLRSLCPAPSHPLSRNTTYTSSLKVKKMGSGSDSLLGSNITKIRKNTYLEKGSLVGRGWSGGAMVLGKLPVPGRPASLDYSRARAYCACSGCGWGLFGHFFSRLSFLFSFSLSLGDGPI